MFAIIGILLAFYVLYAVLAGEVYSKAGAWGRSISRRESPGDFWMTIVIYAGLAIALVTVF